jgi:hypothetical protein
MLANGITGTRDMMDCPQATDPLIACVADKRRWTAQAIAGQQVAPRFVQIASFYFEDPRSRRRPRLSVHGRTARAASTR